MSSMVEQEMTEDRISKLEDKPINLTLFKKRKICLFMSSIYFLTELFGFWMLSFISS